MYLFLLYISFKGKERSAKADFMVAKLHSVNQRRVRLPAVFVGTEFDSVMFLLLLDFRKMSISDPALFYISPSTPILNQ